MLESGLSKIYFSYQVETSHVFHSMGKSTWSSLFHKQFFKKQNMHYISWVPQPPQYIKVPPTIFQDSVGYIC